MASPLGLHKLARDSIYNIGRQIWSIGLGLLTSIVLARGLGTDDRGIYAVVLLLPTLLVTFLNGGIGAASVYFIARGERDLGRSIPENLLFSVVSSLIGIGIGAGAVYFAHDTLFPGIPVPHLLLGLLLVPIMLSRDNLQVIFQGLQDFRTYNFIGLIPQLVTLILTLILVWFLHTGVNGAVFALVFGNFASLIMTAVLLRIRSLKIGIGFTQPSWRSIKQLLTYGLLIHLSNIIVFFNYRVDIFLLNILSNKTSVGLYDVAVTLAERLWILSSAISIVIYPRIASLTDETQKRQITPIVARYAFWFIMIAAAVVYGIAEWLIVLLYGSNFRTATWALRMLIPGIVMDGVSKVLANDIAGRGKPEINMLVALTASIINVIANLILVPQLNLVGSAIASSISYSVLALMLIFTFCRLSGTAWWRLFVMTGEDVRLWRGAFAALRQRLSR